MKIFIEKDGWNRKKGTWCVKLTQGVQTFQLLNLGFTETDARWQAKMLRKAMKAYREEISRD